MNAKQLITAAFLLTIAGAAYAQQADGSASHTSGNNATPTGKTRAEVIAELKQAQSNHSAMPSGFVAFDVPVAVSANSAPIAVASR